MQNKRQQVSILCFEYFRCLEIHFGSQLSVGVFNCVGPCCSAYNGKPVCNTMLISCFVLRNACRGSVFTLYQTIKVNQVVTKDCYFLLKGNVRCITVVLAVKKVFSFLKRLYSRLWSCASMVK